MKINRKKLLKVSDIFGAHGVSTSEVVFYSKEQISDRLKRYDKYLLVEEAAAFKCCDEFTGVLARIRFPLDLCEGHYPKYPGIPLVDVGRAAKQVAGFFCALRESPSKEHIPVFKRCAQIQTMSAETCEAEGIDYWIWATMDCDSYVTRYYSGLTYDLIAVVKDWSFDFVKHSEMLSRLRPETNLSPKQWQGVTVEQHLDTTEIYKRTPQRPPFYIICEAEIGRSQKGNLMIRTRARFPSGTMIGYLQPGKGWMGPIHYSRAMAQTGMLLSTFFTDRPTDIPEVLNTKSIALNSDRIFSEENDIVVIEECKKSFKTSRGTKLSLITGTVYVGEHPVLVTEEICYIHVPRASHIVGLRGVSRVITSRSFRNAFAPWLRCQRRISAYKRS